MSRSAAGGIAMVLAAAVLWGTTGTAQSFAPGTMPAHWVGALRLAVSALFFAVIVAAAGMRGSRLRALARLDWRIALAAGVGVALYNLCFFAGIRLTGVAIGTALAIGSGPIWAGLLSTIVNRRSPTRLWWTGTGLAVAGGMVMVLRAGGALALEPLGMTLCLIAGFAYAGYAMLNSRLARAGHPSELITLAVFGSATLIALPVAAAMPGQADISARGLAVVAWLGIVATGLAYLLFTRALRSISSATGVSLALAEPVTAFMLAIVVIGERPGAMAAVGLALVLAGLALVIRTELGAAQAARGDPQPADRSLPR